MNIALDKFVSDLVGNGERITAAAILSPTSVSPPKLKLAVLAQKGLNLKLNEVVGILEYLSKHTMHQNYIGIGNHQYLITSIQERSYYGRNVNTDIGGGIVLQKTSRSIILATYPKTSEPSEIIPDIERFVETFPE